MSLGRFLASFIKRIRRKNSASSALWVQAVHHSHRLSSFQRTQEKHKHFKVAYISTRTEFILCPRSASHLEWYLICKPKSTCCSNALNYFEHDRLYYHQGIPSNISFGSAKETPLRDVSFTHHNISYQNKS